MYYFLNSDDRELTCLWQEQPFETFSVLVDLSRNTNNVGLGL